jgi:DNA polymerase III sliding clamp (beta) subunit (PCNA family)
MKFSLHESEWKRLASLLRPLGLPKQNLPILTHVRFEHCGSTIMAYATDLECSLIAPLTPFRTGPPAGMHASIPVSLVLRIAREMDKETTVQLVLVEDHAHLEWSVKGMDMRQVEQCFPLHDFPPVDTSGHDRGLWAPASLLRILKQALPHVSEDETRFVLLGVHFDPVDHNLVATDGRRLYCSRSPVALPCSAIVPTAAVQYLTQHMGDEGPIWFKTESVAPDAPVEAKGGLAQLAGNALFMFRTIIGSYPRYQQVIPKGLPHQANLEIDREGFLLHLGQLTGDSARVAFRFGAHTWSVSYRPGDGRTPTEWMRIGTTTYGGPAITCLYYGAYMHDAIRTLDQPTFWYQDESSPGLFRAGDAQVVIMPMRPGPESEVTSSSPARPVMRPVSTATPAT